jgi:hypothetical protein
MLNYLHLGLHTAAPGQTWTEEEKRRIRKVVSPDHEDEDCSSSSQTSDFVEGSASHLNIFKVFDESGEVFYNVAWNLSPYEQEHYWESADSLEDLLRKIG